MSRTLNFVFRQMNQKFYTVLSLVDVRIGFFNGFEKQEVTVPEIDQLLETLCETPEVADRFFSGAVEDRANSPEPELRGRPAQMRFQNLADVHPARHPERVEDDVHRRSIFQERHIFYGQNLRDDAQ